MGQKDQGLSKAKVVEFLKTRRQDQGLLLVIWILLVTLFDALDIKSGRIGEAIFQTIIYSIMAVIVGYLGLKRKL